MTGKKANESHNLAKIMEIAHLVDVHLGSFYLAVN